MAEAIVVARAARSRDEQPDRLGGGRRDALRAKEVRQAVPSRGRVADPERLEHLVDPASLPGLEPALRELLERVLAMLVAAQLLFEERRRERVHRIEFLARLLLAIGLGEAGVLPRLLDRDPARSASARTASGNVLLYQLLLLQLA